MLRTNIFDTYCIINRQDDYVNLAFNNDGNGRDYGIDLTLERYMQGGWHGMVNGSLYKAECRANVAYQTDKAFSEQHDPMGVVDLTISYKITGSIHSRGGIERDGYHAALL